ncbi:MAG: hypothetical protein RJA63_3610, partial [Pseudomonadota bacterium]
NEDRRALMDVMDALNDGNSAD